MVLMGGQAPTTDSGAKASSKLSITNLARFAGATKWGQAAQAQGYVASTKTTESGDLPSGTVVLRVPADSYDSVLAQARKLGTVDSQTSSGTDVTAQSADLQAKMTSLKKVRAFLPP